jgi:hypothetical protein
VVLVLDPDLEARRSIEQRVPHERRRPDVSRDALPRGVNIIERRRQEHQESLCGSAFLRTPAVMPAM